jgi:hypothetical protein
LIAELAVQQQQSRATSTPAGPLSPQDDLTVSEMILAFLGHVDGYYGSDLSEPAALNLALRPVNSLYGRSRANDFDPKSLKAVRQHMIEVEQLSRGEVNRRTGACSDSVPSSMSFTTVNSIAISSHSSW